MVHVQRERDAQRDRALQSDVLGSTEPDDAPASPLRLSDDALLRLSEQFRLRDRVTIRAPNRVREREDFDEHETVHRVHVVHVDLLCVRVERRVDVFVNEREHVGLLHGDHVVGVQGLGRVGASELLVERQELDGRSDLLFGDGVEVLAVRAFEGKPHREREKVAEGERGFVERLTERFGKMRSERRLRALETFERFIELSARAVVVVGESFSNAFERSRRHRRVRWNRSNGRTSDPHESST